MVKNRGASLYRLFFSVLAIVAIVVQFMSGLDRPSFSLANFFSFFTIQSNILAAVIFLIAGIAGLAGKQILSSRTSSMAKVLGGRSPSGNDIAD